MGSLLFLFTTADTISPVGLCEIDLRFEKTKAVMRWDALQGEIFSGRVTLMRAGLKGVIRNLVNLSIQWWLFISTLIVLRRGKFVIYNTATWHFGWDYQKRSRVYRNYFGRREVLAVDLNSNLMISVLRITGIISEREKLSNEEVEFFKRSNWDLLIRNWSNFPVTTDEYTSVYKSRSAELMPASHAPAVKALMKQERFSGLVITQESYDDWAWARLCVDAKKPLHIPESLLGSIVRRNLDLEDDRKYFETLTRHMDCDATMVAEAGLLARINGDYAKSSLSEMVEITSTLENVIVGDGRGSEEGPVSTQAPVFFLHAFGDSPNASIYDYSNLSFLDYYHFTLHIFDIFEKASMQLWIKSHPWSRLYKTDQHCLKSVRQRIEESKFISELPGNFSTRDMLDWKKPLAITGRGSVIAECAFLGIPSVSFYPSLYTKLAMSTLLNADVGAEDFEALAYAEFKPVVAKRAALAYEYFLNQINRERFFTLKNYARDSVSNCTVMEYRNI